ncbi:MAG: hypothetical protein AABZ53_12790 [Planctomycetota bacterium]
MDATPTHPTPCHIELLGAYAKLGGDLTALCDRFSLNGLQLLAFLDDPAIKERLITLDPILAASAIKRYQTAAAEALTQAFKATQDPVERRRSATILARITFHWGQLPSPPRAPRATTPASPDSQESRPPASSPTSTTCPTEPAPQPYVTPIEFPIRSALDLSDLLPTLAPQRAPAQLAAAAGIAPVARASSP